MNYIYMQAAAGVLADDDDDAYLRQPRTNVSVARATSKNELNSRMNAAKSAVLLVCGGMWLQRMLSARANV